MRPGDGPLRTLDGPITATNPVPTGLVDPTGADLGTADNPLRVKDALPGVSFVHKFGDHPAIPATTSPVDCWPLGTASNVDDWWVAAGFVPEAVSGDAADVGVLTISGISSVDGTEISEALTMTGTTPITFSGSYHCVYRAAYENGDLNPNDGDITISDVATSTARAFIGSNQGQTLQAFYCIPAGFVGRLLNVHKVTGRGDEVAVELQTAAAGKSWRVREILRGYEGEVEHTWGEFANPGSAPELEAGTRVKGLMRRVSGTRCSISFAIALFEI